MRTTIGGEVRRSTISCRVAALFFMALLSACSGGSSDNQASTSVSTNTIAFTAASPDAPTPPSQTFTATLSSGTTYVVVLHNGAAIANASYTLSGNTVQVVVDPASPASLGAGNLTGTVTVTGYGCGDPSCSAPFPGNTQIINVTYQISPIVRFVAPYVATANTAGTVIIRGQGFRQFSVTGVSFGATAATSFTVLSDTEIQASYPALAANTYAVQIQASGNPGTITSQASLVMLNAPGYTATTIAFPSATPQVKRILYDAERQAILVAVDTSGGEVLRYVYSGGWVFATSATVNTLSDISLSGDGNQLLALSQSALTPLDPATLAAGTAIPAPTFATTGTVFNSLVMGNDGKAVATTGYPPSTSTALYVYSACNSISIGDATCTPAFSQPGSTPTLDNSTATGSADGSLIAIMQGDSTLTSPPAVYQYTAASDAFSATPVALNQNPVAPAVDVYTPADSTTSTTRIVLSGTDASNAAVTNVYDASYNLLGTLPNTTLAVVVKPDATRAYTYDSATSQVLSFDLTATPAGGAYPQVGSGVTLAGNPGSGVKMTISPDGGTLFLAGSSQIVVQPAPP
jgi:hypothetical protein